jgi:hypothetical protein
MNIIGSILSVCVHEEIRLGRLDFDRKLERDYARQQRAFEPSRRERPKWLFQLVHSFSGGAA